MGAILAALAVGAHGQSIGNAGGALYYSFSLDANSATLGQYLTVIDGGLTTFNFNNSNPGGYGTSTGTGTYSNTANPSQNYYSSSSWSGENSTDSISRQTGSSGTASASIGTQEDIYFDNSGSSPISVDLTVLVQPGAVTNISGPSSPTNFASASSTQEFLDIASSGVVADEYVTSYDNNNDSPTTVADPNYSTITLNGFTAYTTTYVMTIAGGDNHTLALFAESQSSTGTGQPVPEPCSLFVLAIGALGLARRRTR